MRSHRPDESWNPREDRGDCDDESPHGVPSDRDALVSEFLRTSREMIAAQRDVLLTYFGATAGAPPAAPVAAVPQVIQAVPELPTTQPAVAAATAEPTGDSAPSPATGPVDVQQVVLEIISERTGYPVDMIEPDLDLEADLSIDSIKRAEIAGELARRLGAGAGADLASMDDDELEELAKARTAAAVTDWLTARLGGPAAPAPTAEPDPTVAAAVATPATGPATPGQAAQEVTGEPPRRHVLRPVLLDAGTDALPAPAAVPSTALAGTRWILLGKPRRRRPGWCPTAPTSPYGPGTTS